MPFLRPEAITALKRWQEPLLIGVLLLAALRLLWLAYIYWSWLLGLAGLGLTVISGSLLYVALIRLALRRDDQGPGYVEIDERNITYLAPHLGGSVAIDSIRKIDISPSRTGGRNWILYSTDGPPVLIPFSAAGADGLIEAFSALSGLGLEKIRRAARGQTLVIETVWVKAG